MTVNCAARSANLADRCHRQKASAQDIEATISHGFTAYTT
jgi:hypothetical protein